jgi:hypothetical protein
MRSQMCAPAFVASLAALPLTTGCESTDPCIRREAACLDVVLIGKKDPVYYRGLNVKVAFPAMSLAPMTQDLGELRATAVAGVQGKLSFQLPSEFNAQDDMALDPLLEGLDEAAQVTKLKELRKTDKRIIRVTIQGTEVSPAGQGKVCWDSVDEESRFSDEQWIHLKYYRVGKNQYQGVHAVLYPQANNAPCPASP